MIRKAEYPAAEYLARKIADAIPVVSSAAKAFMDWFRDVARAVIELDTPLAWTTPTGFRAQQNYRAGTKKRVDTVLGKFYLEGPDLNTSRLDKRKQATAVAPNITHSLDASALALTVVRSWDAGVRDFAMVHDSYGCHAGNMQTLRDQCRRAFVDINIDDPLETMKSEIERTHSLSLPPLPPRGDLDLLGILASDYQLH